MRVEVDIANLDETLLPGMFTNADIQLDIHNDTLSLPANTVATKGGKSTVLIVEDEKIKQVVVKLGYDDAIHTEIVDGLSGTEQVVSSSREGLTDGVAVTSKPVNALPDSSGGH